MNFNNFYFNFCFLVTFLLTPIVKRVALSLKIVDHPNNRKIHITPVPKLGSISVYAGFLCVVYFSGIFDSIFQEEFAVILSQAQCYLS